jgi:DNA-damage-inducible protein D
MARQLSKVLDYTDFRNFTGVIEKAWNACKNSGNDPKDHIVEDNEMVTIGSRSPSRNFGICPGSRAAIAGG